jgi:hypothetical protein
MTVPIVAPGRASITRQGLDQALANVAAGFGEYMNNAGSVQRLATVISELTTEMLTGSPDDPTNPGFGYTSDQAYAIQLFGQMLSAALAYWSAGTAIPAQTDPTPAAHGVRFVGL